MTIWPSFFSLRSTWGKHQVVRRWQWPRYRRSSRAGLLLVCLCTFCLPSAIGLAVDTPQLTVPSFNDKYSMFVGKLESGQTDINYKEFRESFLESKQFQIAASKKSELDQLQAVLPGLIAQSKYSEIIQAAMKILSIDYTSMRAHKALQQTFRMLKDEANRQKYHDIEFGLLNSIIKRGDGKSCETAWQVVQIEEEYFILGVVLGATLTRQSIVNKGGLCDKMEFSRDKKADAVCYFGIAKAFEGARDSENK